MSDAVIDLAEKVKRAYYERKYYEFAEQYRKLLSQYELSPKTPMNSHLLGESKKYHASISTCPEYKTAVRHHGVVPHTPLLSRDSKSRDSKTRASKSEKPAVFVPAMPPAPAYKPAAFVREGIKFHNENMDYLFSTQAQRQQLMSTTFDKARLR